MVVETKNDFQVCFEAVDGFVSKLDSVRRDLEEAEIHGLTKLIDEHGAEKVLEALAKISEEVYQETFDIFTVKRRNEFVFRHLGIDEWLEMKIQAEEKLLARVVNRR